MGIRSRAELKTFVWLSLALFGTAPIWNEVYLPAVQSEASSTAWIALAMVGFLSWVLRRKFEFTHEVNSLGLLGLGFGIVMMALGGQLDSSYLMSIGAMATIWSSVACNLTKASLKAMVPIGVVLLLGIQLPGSVSSLLTVPLARINATLVGYVLEMVGHSNEVLGTLIESNDLQVQVVDACDGLSLFWAVLLLSFTQLVAGACSLRTYVITLAIAPLLSILLNTVRILATSLLFAEISHDAAEVAHDVLGLLLLIAAWFLPWGVIRLVECKRASIADRIAPLHTVDEPKSGGRAVALQVFCCLLVFCVGSRIFTPAVASGPTERSSTELAENLFSSIPFRLGDFIGVEEPLPSRQLDILQPSEYLSLRFRGSEPGQQFLVILTVHQDKDEIKKHPVEKCYSNVGWRINVQTSSRERAASHEYSEVRCHLVRDRKTGLEEMFVVKGSIVGGEKHAGGKAVLPLAQLQMVFDSGVQESVRKSISDEITKLIRNSYDTHWSNIVRLEGGGEHIKSLSYI